MVLRLGNATANVEEPIESLEWLVTYFQGGWGLDPARHLAAYYSYFDGEHYYIGATDDVMPPLLVATSATLIEITDQSAVVEAQFTALDGPFQSGATMRRYALIQEDGP